MTTTHKESCGGCTKCQPTASPYDEQVQVVWHDPTTYDIKKHGPPYLKDGSDQKAVVASTSYSYDRRAAQQPPATSYSYDRS